MASIFDAFPSVVLLVSAITTIIHPNECSTRTTMPRFFFFFFSSPSSSDFFFSLRAFFSSSRSRRAVSFFFVACLTCELSQGVERSLMIM